MANGGTSLQEFYHGRRGKTVFLNPLAMYNSLEHRLVQIAIRNCPHVEQAAYKNARVHLQTNYRFHYYRFHFGIWISIKILDRRKFCVSYEEVCVEQLCYYIPPKGFVFLLIVRGKILAIQLACDRTLINSLSSISTGCNVMQ